MTNKNARLDSGVTPQSEMRVLFVLPRIVAGGVERATLNLIDGLQRQNVTCRLALGRVHGELAKEAMALTSVDEVAVSGKWLFAFGLLRVLRHFRPTHIITAFADVTFMALVARFLAGSRTPVIVGVHGTLQEQAGAGGWRVRFQYVFYGWLAGLVYRHCAAIVAVSQGVAKDVRDRHPSSLSRLVVIDNPVFTDAMRQRIAKLQPAAPRGSVFLLVALGRLAYEKGFDILIRAMPAILSEHDVHLDIYGAGVERLRLQTLIESLQLQSRVTLKGNTLDPLAAISSADLFVFPSRHEGFGVALVEALACGKQIVASDCPHGPSEILKKGALGQLVAPDDPHALAKAVCMSLSGVAWFDPELLRTRAADFAAEVAVGHYLTLLRSLDGPRSAA